MVNVAEQRACPWDLASPESVRHLSALPLVSNSPEPAEKQHTTTAKEHHQAEKKVMVRRLSSSVIGSYSIQPSVCDQCRRCPLPVTLSSRTPVHSQHRGFCSRRCGSYAASDHGSIGGGAGGVTWTRCTPTKSIRGSQSGAETLVVPAAPSLLG